MYTLCMNYEQIFSRLGLEKHASDVYELLWNQKDPLLLAHIAKRIGVARPQVYRVVESLLEKRFIKKIKNGKRTYYAAENPRRVEEAFTNISKKVSDKSERYAAKREKELPEYIRFFRDFSGIRAVFDDVIAHTPRGDTFYRYTSEKDLASVNKYLSPLYRSRRDQKKLERLVISNPVSGKQKRPRLERFIKYVQPDADVFDQDIIQLVYGKRVAFININTEEAFIIEDAALASFQKSIFKQLYKKL
jgi:sugar-specific transcriptional regulator TrmB